MDEPRLTGTSASLAASAKRGSASRPPTSSSENAVRPPTSVSVSNPAVVSILNWTAAPAALPPGRLLVTALPARPAVTTRNQPLVRSASRCKAKLQVKDTSSAARQTVNQTGFSVDRGGQARDELGQHQVERRRRDGQRPHDDRFPGQRARLRGIYHGGLHPDRTGLPGVDGLPSGC